MSVRWGLLTFGMTVALGLGGWSTTAAAGRIVCWDEADGRRACGDRVPPEFTKQERQVYDKKGRLVRTLPRQKTPEEVAAEAKEKADLAERRKKLEEAAAYDRFLISTFASLKDLERTRDDRLSTLDGRLLLAEKSLVDNQKGIAELEKQVEDFKKENPKKPVPRKLTKELNDFKGTLGNNTRVVEALKVERKGIVDKFTYDIGRYKELKENRADPDGSKAAANALSQPGASAEPETPEPPKTP